MATPIYPIRLSARDRAELTELAGLLGMVRPDVVRMLVRERLSLLRAGEKQVRGKGPSKVQRERVQ